MFKQIIGRARAGLSCVLHLRHAQPLHRAAHALAAAVVLLCVTVMAAPAMAQTVSLTSVSPSTYSAKGQEITFIFNVDSNSTPITGVTFNGGAPSTFASSNCSTITYTGTCTATYKISDEDMVQGRVQVSPSFQMSRAAGDGTHYQWAAGTVSTPSAPFWILANATPSDPGNVAAVAGVGSATVSFSPSNVPGGTPVTYLVMSTDFTAMAQGNSSPVVVTGLTPGKSYQFNVQAMSAGYSSLQVGPSNRVIPIAPNVSIAVSPAAVREDSGTALVYTVTRDVALTTPTTVNLTFSGTATAGIDYSGNVASVTIPANASSIALRLVPVADATAEADETATVSVAVGSGYTVGSPSSATGTIVNANPTTLTINDVRLNEGNASQTDFVFTVSLNQPAGAGGVSFDYATADGTATAGTDYVAASGTMTIPAGSSSTTISVKVNGDADYESDETFFVNLSDVSGATTVDGQGVGTILNDDPVPVPAIISISPASGPAAGGTAVTLTGANFSGATAVTFGAKSAVNVIVNSATSIAATSPAGSAGTVDITVTTPGGTSTTSAADRFTYVSVPNAVAITVANVPYNSGVVSIPIDTSNHVTSVAVAAAASHGTAAASGNALTYIPAAGYAGQDSFTYTLTNVAGTSTPARVTVMVLPPTITVSPPTLPAAVVGTSYSQTVSASGGAAPYRYALVGTPPNGLALSSTGELSGMPTTQGTFNFDVEVKDSSIGSNAPFLKTQSYSLTVLPPLTVTSITRVDASPSNASNLRFQVTFSEPVSGVDTSDFSLTRTDTASGMVQSVLVSGAGETYTLQVGNVSGNGTLRLDLNASGTGIRGVMLGNAIDAGFTSGQVYTVDTTAPEVTSVSVPAAGRYQAGSTLDFVVTFNEVLVVTGTPQLALMVGGSTVYANYVAGSGTSALIFTYAVASGDRDDDGIAVGALGLNGGSLKDAVGNDAHRTLNNVSATNGVLVGLMTQAITGFTATPANPVFSVGGTFAVSATGGASGEPVVFASTTPSVCTVSGSTVTMVNAGSCALTADQAGNANYSAAPQ
ncbi:Calx-beta domain-containing protein, partial [Stenotrophomonas sp.]|uniref:Calx-beta domain-containing protein n=1 Tax=Stenotrophomonas sp. TaxID=69392 RepID=UPI0028A90E58